MAFSPEPADQPEYTLEQRAFYETGRIVFPTARWAEKTDWEEFHRAQATVLGHMTAGEAFDEADILAAMDAPDPAASRSPAEKAFMDVLADPENRRKLAAFDLTRQIGIFLADRGAQVDEYDGHLLAGIIGAGLRQEEMLAGWSEGGTFPDNTWPVEEWWTHYMDMETTDSDRWAIAPQGETDGV